MWKKGSKDINVASKPFLMLLVFAYLFSTEGNLWEWWER